MSLLQAISLPEDVLYLGRMNAAMQHLLMDNDHDTAEAARLVSNPSGCCGAAIIPVGVDYWVSAPAELA